MEEKYLEMIANALCCPIRLKDDVGSDVTGSCTSLPQELCQIRRVLTVIATCMYGEFMSNFDKKDFDEYKSKVVDYILKR